MSKTDFPLNAPDIRTNLTFEEGPEPVDSLAPDQFSPNFSAIVIGDESFILFFDGNCGLCDGLVRFVLDRDALARFRFASLQSDFAKRFFADHGLNTTDLDSVVLFKEDQFFVLSSAAIEVFAGLPGVWSFGRVLRCIPRRIRDHVYRWIAANRYRFFGRLDECRLPTAAESSRFLS